MDPAEPKFRQNKFVDKDISITRTGLFFPIPPFQAFRSR